MNEKNCYLKDNAEEIRKAIEEVFTSNESLECRGSLIHFEYTEEDCGDLRPLGSTAAPKNAGPGIRHCR